MTVKKRLAFDPRIDSNHGSNDSNEPHPSLFMKNILRRFIRIVLNFPVNCHNAQELRQYNKLLTERQTVASGSRGCDDNTGAERIMCDEKLVEREIN